MYVVLLLLNKIQHSLLGINRYITCRLLHLVARDIRLFLDLE